LEGGIRVPGLLQWPDVITKFHHTKYPAATYDFLPTVEDLLSQLPDDPTYTAIANHRYKTNADWDGESWKNIIEHAAGQTSPSPDHVAEQFDRGKHLYIAAHKDGLKNSGAADENKHQDFDNVWAFYSKSGQYKVYTKENRMVDLWADPREVSDLVGSSFNSIKNGLMSEYGPIKDSYEASRTAVKQNWNNGNSWEMCYGQNTNN
jgi:arylsulfatase A-like enzyme